LGQTLWFLFGQYSDSIQFNSIQLFVCPAFVDHLVWIFALPVFCIGQVVSDRLAFGGPNMHKIFKPRWVKVSRPFARGEVPPKTKRHGKTTRVSAEKQINDVAIMVIQRHLFCCDLYRSTLNRVMFMCGFLDKQCVNGGPF